MYTKIGNIWDFETFLTPIVIPTNIGWKNDESNVMGAGVAKQAAHKYPELPYWYGKECKKHGKSTPVLKHPGLPIICAPVKQLNEQKPWLSWKNNADLELIEKTIFQLSEIDYMYNHVYVTLLGCGNGKLDVEDIFPLLVENLNDKFTLIVTEKDYYNGIKDLLKDFE